MKLGLNAKDALNKSGKIIEWRYDIPQFFRDVLRPANSYGIDELSNYQKDFLNDMADLGENRILMSSGRNTGKTIVLAMLSVWAVSVLPYFLDQPYQVVVLGGSLTQSTKLYEYTKGWFEDSDFLNNKLEDEPMKSHTDLEDGSKIAALTASEKSVRGQHCHCLIVDEAAEVDEELINAAIPVVSSKTPNRIIFSSTPHRYRSKFVDLWKSAKEDEIEYSTYNWSIMDAHWVDSQAIDEAKKLYDKATYKVEIEGEPFKMTGSVFDIDDLRASVVDEKPKIDSDANRVLGVDYGFKHKTVLTIVQIKDDIYEVIDTFSFQQTRFKKIQEKIKEAVEKYDISMIYPDDSHKGENQRLREDGFNVNPVSFSGGHKQTLVSKLRSLFENQNIRIPYTEKELINQLKRYQYQETKTGREVTSKTKDDFVDSLLLAVQGRSSSDRAFQVVV